jgi:hypothetical protein
VMVPSDTLTPIWGITTSTAVPVLTAWIPRRSGVDAHGGERDALDAV